MKKTVKRKKNMPIYTGGKREKKKFLKQYTSRALLHSSEIN
jgi:hypothetical protein